MHLPVQGAVVGSMTAMAFNVWIVVGNFLASPHRRWLATATARYGNGTESSTTDAILNSTTAAAAAGLDDVTAATMMTSSRDATGFDATTELLSNAST